LGFVTMLNVALRQEIHHATALGGMQTDRNRVAL
jgi:hypothetical protein